MSGRPLKLWNGCIYPYRGETGYVAAYSRADAVRVINEALGHKAVSDHELKTYWHEGCWGDAMEGITPERGLRVKGREHDAVVRRVEAEKDGEHQ